MVPISVTQDALSLELGQCNGMNSTKIFVVYPEKVSDVDIFSFC